ncbi:MAG: PQQ-binding-like beta-propeller repeat protein [Chlorobi bacterium]|nr:PQQ-binding-like beta-propeller repeat protein [Chlorobiota bacterium]MCI0714968.1 PQQ-binding-like beta-propeller repeat protein [Chlorobiota bacterium]
MFKKIIIFSSFFLIFTLTFVSIPKSAKSAGFKKGWFLGAVINLSASSFNFGTRRVNSLCGFTFDVTNQGSEKLVINSVSFRSQSFRFDNTIVNFPITIAPQKTRTFRIWFNPNTASFFSDEAAFYSNAVNESVSRVFISGSGQYNLTDLGDILWEGNIPPNPNTSFQDYQPKSMKQIGDVNNDGVNDIIVATENYWTICYNGNSSVTADTLWKFNTHFGTNNTGSVDWEDAMQIMDDINSDGVEEVVIGCGGGNEEVYVLNGRTGAKIWEYPGPGSNYDGDINGLRCDKDYNNDNINDVLISASGEGNGTGRHAVICLNGLNGKVIFNQVQNSEFTHDVVSLPNGGAIGIATNGGPYAVNGFNNSGNNMWNYPVTSAVWSLRQVPDINNDNNPDIIGLWGFTGGIFALSGTTGSQIWVRSLGSSNNGTVEVLDDLNRDGFIDVTFSGPQTAARVDTKTNTVLWTTPFSSSYIRDVGFLGDVTGDTLGEVLYSTQQPGRVFVLNGQSGAILFEYTFGTTIQQRADRVTLLNSIDTNASNEFVACSRDGRIKCFSGGPLGVVGIGSNDNNVLLSFLFIKTIPIL